MSRCGQADAGAGVASEIESGDEFGEKVEALCGAIASIFGSLARDAVGDRARPVATALTRVRTPDPRCCRELHGRVKRANGTRRSSRTSSLAAVVG